MPPPKKQPRKYHLCPICACTLETNPRYLEEICDKCSEKTTDIDGRAVTFYNKDMRFGCIAYFSDSNQKEEYKSNICYVNSIKCFAEEKYFGGIVIQPYKEK